MFFFLQLPALGFLSAADEIGAHTVLTAAEAVTARSMRSDLDLRIGRTAAAHADVFAHDIIKEIIILQDESRLIIELLRRDLFQILPARLRNTAWPQPSDSPKQQTQPVAGT